MTHFTVKMYFFDFKNERKLQIFEQKCLFLSLLLQNPSISVRIDAQFLIKTLDFQFKNAFLLLKFFSCDWPIPEIFRKTTIMGQQMDKGTKKRYMVLHWLYPSVQIHIKNSPIFPYWVIPAPFMRLIWTTWSWMGFNGLKNLGT